MVPIVWQSAVDLLLVQQWMNIQQAKRQQKLQDPAFKKGTGRYCKKVLQSARRNKGRLTRHEQKYIK